MEPKRDLLARIEIDERDPKPTYAQIADAIRGLILSKKLAGGTQLPPERALCQQYGVSRMTLRQAYGVLERERLIERRRGHGTFVSAGRIQRQEQQMRSFTEEITARGGVPSSRLLSFRVKEPDRQTREFFSLPVGEQVYELSRLRLRDGEPIAVEFVEIPCYVCPRLDRFNLVTQSLYRIFEEEYGLRLSLCIEEISAAQPTREQKKILQIPPGTVVLVVRRETYTANDTPVELGTTTYRADLYTAIVRSVRAIEKA